ncbi:MAG: hypothetical protein K2Y17_03865 [Qipengyuania sp.]|jgi:hypothetical protein|nr:hypothetical protein [Qipengyuania sp.]
MADHPGKQTPDKQKFAPKNVTADPKANDDHRADLKGRDLPRGSEVETREASGGRG